MSKLTTEQAASLAALKAEMLESNTQLEREQSEVDSFISKYDSEIDSIKSSFKTFVDGLQYNHIANSTAVFTAKVTSYLDSLPNVDASLLKSQRIAKSGHHSTKSVFALMIGNNDTIKAFRESPTIGNVTADMVIAGNIPWSTANYKVINELCHAKTLHSGSDKGLRGVIESYDNSDRNVKGRRCFSDTISQKIRDKSSTTGMSWTDSEAAEISDSISLMYQAEHADDETIQSVCLINRQLVTA